MGRFGFGHVLTGAALLAILGYGCNKYVNLNEGYESLRNNLKIVDKLEKVIENFFEPGREQFAETFHTIQPSLDPNYFEESTPRTSQGIESLSGYAQNAALGAAFLSFLYLMYCGIRGKK